MLSDAKYALRFILVVIVHFSLYLLNNRFQIFNATSIQLSFIDRAVNFNPYAVYIYNFAYIMPVIIYMRLCYLKSHRTIQFFLYHFFITSIAANLIFLLFPTTLYNEYFHYSFEQLLSISDTVTAYNLHFIFTADKPFNCFPSLHVAIAFVAAMALHNDKKIIIFSGYLFATWIAFSTLQVKQHLLYDIISGIALSLITYVLTKKLVNRF